MAQGQRGRLCATSRAKAGLERNRGPVKATGGKYRCSSTRASGLTAGASRTVTIIRSTAFDATSGARVERNGEV